MSRAVEAESQEAVLSSGIELLPLADARGDPRGGARTAKPSSDGASAIVAGDRRQLKVLDMPIEDGTVGGAHRRLGSGRRAAEAEAG